MMLENPLFWLLCCGHLVGDFYFQSHKMAKDKREPWPGAPQYRRRAYRNAMLLHCFLYADAILLFVLPVTGHPANMATGGFFLFLLPAVGHAATDLVKERLVMRKTEALRSRLGGNELAEEMIKLARRTLVADQLVHIAMLWAVAAAWGGGSQLNAFGQLLQRLYATLGLPVGWPAFVRLLFILLLIGKPANVFIRCMNPKAIIDKTARQGMLEEAEPGDARPAAALKEEDAPRPRKGEPDRAAKRRAWRGTVQQQAAEREYKRAGATIGFLERLLVAVLFLAGQYGAVGLVFAAKTLTRYGRITKSQPFAEYYLIGTLTSMLLVLGAVLLARPLG